MKLVPFAATRDCAPALWSVPRDFDRIVDSFLGSALSSAENGEARWVPAIDIRETPDALVLRADVPGMEKQNLEISLNGNVLTLSGERKREEQAEGEGWRRNERAHGRFERSIRLPDDVDGTKLDAAYENGVLTVTAPKREERKPRTISIR